MKKQLMILTIALAGTGLINAANKDLASQVSSLQEAINKEILPAIKEQSEKLNELADKVTKLQEGKKVTTKAPKKATKEVEVLEEEPEEETVFVEE